MKEPRFCICSWNDAHGDAGDSATLENVRDKHRPVLMETAGWLLWDDEVGVSLFNERDLTDGSYRGRTFIPRSLIVSTTEVRLVKPKRKKVSHDDGPPAT